MVWGQDYQLCCVHGSHFNYLFSSYLKKILTGKMGSIWSILLDPFIKDQHNLLVLINVQFQELKRSRTMTRKLSSDI